MIINFNCCLLIKLFFRDASFLTLSSPITYIPCELYDLVRKLGEYKLLDESEYLKLTQEHQPTFHWGTRLMYPLPKSNEETVQKLLFFKRKHNLVPWFGLSVDDLRQLLRNCYEHYASYEVVVLYYATVNVFI